MIIVCAWCKQVMGTKEPMEQMDITGGICDSCYQNLITEIEQFHREQKEVKGNGKERLLCPWCQKEHRDGAPMPDYKWSPGALLTITITEKGLRDLREAIAKAQGKEREDPEKELRALWDKWGIPKEK